MPDQLPPGNWHNEKWATSIAELPQWERMSLISAVTMIKFYAMSDALESELSVFLECACGSDLEEKLYDPQHGLDSFLRHFQEMVEDGVGELRTIREGMPDALSDFYGRLK